MHFMQYVITMMLSCQLKGDRVPRAGDKATPGRHAAGRGSSRYSLMNLAVKLLQEQTNPEPQPLIREAWGSTNLELVRCIGSNSANTFQPLFYLQ